jgi:hypothetical protein
MIDAFNDYKRSLPRRPYLILIASSNTGLICGSNIVPEPPSAMQAAQVLFNATSTT